MTDLRALEMFPRPVLITLKGGPMSEAGIGIVAHLQRAGCRVDWVSPESAHVHIPRAYEGMTGLAHGLVGELVAKAKRENEPQT